MEADYRGDVWHLRDNDPKSQYFGKTYCFDFSFIELTGLMPLIKEYMRMNHMTQNRATRSLKETLLRFKPFCRFALSANLHDFSDLDARMVNRYRSYLATYVSEFTDRPYSFAQQKACFDALKSLVVWAQVNHPGTLTQNTIFTGGEYQGANQRLKIDYLPDEVIVQVNAALVCEENPYLKCGIIILETTGMRVGDLLLLQTNCLGKHPLGGDTLSWLDHKNRTWRNDFPIPPECAAAIRQLIAESESLRKAADADIADLIFLYKPKCGRNRREIVSVSRPTFSKWLGTFSKKHRITDSGGNLYHITSHSFRRTLATDMLSKGTDIKVIQEALCHSSVATTKRYYADVKDKERAEIFSRIGIIGAIVEVGESLIPEKERRDWLRCNADTKARLSDGYCSEPYQGTDICERLKRRQRCYSCSRYITTLDDLPHHRRHIDDLYAVLENNAYGEHYASHIRPLINTLEEIVERLEALDETQ